MNEYKVPYNFKAKLWKHRSEGGWHFVSLSIELSEEIRNDFKREEEGWGRLKVKAQIGNTSWDTAIWFDTKLNCYLLPVKSDVRSKEKLNDGDDLLVIVWI